MPNIKAILKQTKTEARRHFIEAVFGACIVALAVMVLAPTGAQATMDLGPKLLSGAGLDLEVEAMVNETEPYGSLPEAKPRGVRRIVRVPITAYASVPEQTDSTPFITASGTRVRDGVVAANFLPIGTRVRIPHLYGRKEFVVEDRMNARYHYKMDIWMADNEDAKRFGLRIADVEVLDS